MTRGAALALAAALAACSFDPRGVGGDDVEPPDAPPGTPPDAPPETVDAAPDAPPDDPDDDDDDVLDADDNCAAIPNPDQHDEDADAVGDACDNCPHVANPGQENELEVMAGVARDTVGDACDGSGATRERIALFEPFVGDALPAGWTADGGTWTVSGDALHQTDPVQNAFLHFGGALYTTSMTVHTAVTLDVVPPPGATSNVRSVGVLTFHTPDPGDGLGTGYLCTIWDDVAGPTNTELLLWELGGADEIGDGADVGTDMAAGQSMFVAASATTVGAGCFVWNGAGHTDTALATTYTSGFAAVRTNRTAATFPYVVVITPAP